MPGKILILSASPRKAGNSDLLCDQFMKGALEAGNQVEKIFLREKKISYCLACDFCQTHTGICSQKDDVPEIIEKMIHADIIVMATPVYFYSMDGQMKTLIDRTVSRYTEIVDKRFYFIVTAADSGPMATRQTLEGFRAFLSCLEGAREEGAIHGAGVWKAGEIASSPVMITAYEMGKKASPA